MTLADRGDGCGFAATEYDIAASPCPDCAPDTDTQLASTLKDQVQSRDAPIVSVPLPPEAANDAGDPLTLTWHLSVDGAVVVVDVWDDVQPHAPNASAAIAARRTSDRRCIRCSRCTRLASRPRKNFSQD